MRTRMWLGVVTLLAVRTASAAEVPITSNPIPEPVTKRGIAVEVKDLVRLPDTRGLRPADQDVAPGAWARVSYVRDLPDGRRFANDSRGLLYLIDTKNQPQLYLDVGAAFTFGSTVASKAALSVSSFTLNSRRTACSIRCIASAVPGIRKRLTSSRPDTD
jgi:hypothetical protein